MKALLLLLTTLIFIGCSNTPETITVDGTITAEDNMELGGMGNFLTGLNDCHIYMLETDDVIYAIMTPSTSSDPLDSAFVGTFELGELRGTGKSEEYFGGKLSTTEIEFRDLISYK